MNLIYRALITSAALLFSTISSADPILQIYCADCRGTEHSVDFGNFALNQTYGVNSWILEDELIIVNPQGDWVYVDLSFMLEGNILAHLADFIGLDLGIPTGRILIDTLTDTTVSNDYDVSMNMIDTMGPLPVGEQDSPPPGSGSGGGDSSGGGSTGGGGVGSGGGGTGSSGGGSGGGTGGGNACTSAGGDDWHCVSY